MIKNLFALLLVVGLMSSCNFKERELTLQREVDSLRTELAVSEKTSETLQEVGVLMDSIDASRNFLRTSMVEGLPGDIYVTRMRDIHAFVKASEAKIEDLEKAMKGAKSARNKFAASVEKLKKELDLKNLEVAALANEIASYKAETESLHNTVNLQNAELGDKNEQLLAQQQQVTALEEQVNKIVSQAKFDLAEAYYAQAQALELAAHRTNFAPRKKKTTKKEALELYKLAVVTGKPEAQAKVEELEN